jgi:regulator of RNase E activity RraA
MFMTRLTPVVSTVGPTDQHVLESLDPSVVARLTSAMVSDSLDAVGVRGQVMTADVVPVAPGLRAIGRATTIAFAPDDSDSQDPYAAAIDALDTLQPGSFVVIATGSDQRTAYWGELFSAAATGRGAVGTVTDGPTRDTAKVRGLGYPLFGNGTRPLDYRARMSITSREATVRCGGVVVSPGDLVIADDDGVVVVPQQVEGAVLERAVARATAESGVLADLLAGARLREVWTTWGVL